MSCDGCGSLVEMQQCQVRGPRKFCQRGPTLPFVFVFLEGREDPNKYHYKRVINGSPAKLHLNGVSLVCR